MNKSQINLEDNYQSLSKWGKARLIAGSVCFVAIISILLIHLGFSLDNSYRPKSNTITENQLWITSLILGTVGGILFTGKRLFLAALSGLISGVSITYLGLLYFGWRYEIYKIEFIVPLFGVFTGVVFYQLLKKKLRAD